MSHKNYRPSTARTPARNILNVIGGPLPTRASYFHPRSFTFNLAKVLLELTLSLFHLLNMALHPTYSGAIRYHKASPLNCAAVGRLTTTCICRILLTVVWFVVSGGEPLQFYGVTDGVPAPFLRKLFGPRLIGRGLFLPSRTEQAFPENIKPLTGAAKPSKHNMLYNETTPTPNMLCRGQHPFSNRIS